MDLFAGVKKLMQKERVMHAREIAKIDSALAALGHGGGGPKRILSAEARKKISDAQKKRWAKANRS